MSYLAELMLTLSRGAARLEGPRRARHADYLRRQQKPDGGFPGRRGASDIYYTSFALRGLAILGHLDAEIAGRAASFLGDGFEGITGLVDLHCFAAAAGLTQIAAPESALRLPSPARFQQVTERMLESLRRDDGGYAKSPRGGQSSTYHTFLAATLLDALGLADRLQSDRLAAMLVSRQRGDGGFVELPAMRRGGTNPTAAGLVLLSLLREQGLNDGRIQDCGARAESFLADMQAADGGVRASAVVPVSDLLSTFTARAAMIGKPGLGVASINRFVEELEVPGGGFLPAGRSFDLAAEIDVEYTFYGVACLALAEA